MCENIKISMAEFDDIQEIAKLVEQVAKLHDKALPDYFAPVSYAEQLDIINKMIKDDNIVIFKAVIDGKIVGFLFLYINDVPRNGLVHSRYGQILNFGVDEKMRSRGVGTALLKNVENFLMDQGINAIDLDVFAFNKKAISLYEKNGYETNSISMRKILK